MGIDTNYSFRLAQNSTAKEDLQAKPKETHANTIAQQPLEKNPIRSLKRELKERVSQIKTGPSLQPDVAKFQDAVREIKADSVEVASKAREKTRELLGKSKELLKKTFDFTFSGHKRFQEDLAKTKKEEYEVSTSYGKGYLAKKVSENSDAERLVFRHDPDLKLTIGQEGFVFAGTHYIHDERAKNANAYGSRVVCPNVEVKDGKFVEVRLTRTRDPKMCTVFKEHLLKDVAHLAAKDQMAENNPYARTIVYSCSQDKCVSSGSLKSLTPEMKKRIATEKVDACTNLLHVDPSTVSRTVDAILVGSETAPYDCLAVSGELQMEEKDSHISLGPK